MFTLVLFTGVVLIMAPVVYCRVGGPRRSPHDARPALSGERAAMPAHAGLCGHSASYRPRSKHCLCDPACSCAGEHCTRAHAAAGGTDRAGFDPKKCPGCACVSADEAPQPTHRVIASMNRWYASQTRNATAADCQWVCLNENPASSPAWCKCAMFSEAHGGTCTLHANMTGEECGRRGGVDFNTMARVIDDGTCGQSDVNVVCPINATAGRKATAIWPRPVGFSAEIIISHCVQPMTWLGGFLSELERHSATVVKITIIAKCGLSGASYAHGDLPAGTPSPQLRESANVGRCDHTWASYFHDSHGPLASRIFCLKDSYDQHAMFPIVPTRDLAESSQEGFACAYRMHPRTDQGVQLMLCEAEPLFQFSLDRYEMLHDQSRNLTPTIMPRQQENRNSSFTATLRPYGMWARAVLRDTVMWQRAQRDVRTKANPVWPICYGGGFATTREAVQQIAPETWRAIAESMERGDNIEESHYMERTWAALLAPPEMWQHVTPC